MNIELIKKYKAEFEHLLNEGDLLCREINIKVPTDWYEFDNDWSWSVDELEIIINDEFSELRKALCDGKTVQAYYKFNDTWNDIIKPEFKDNVSNYRIKPEELKLKVGDFVRDIISGKVSQVNNEDIANGKYSQVTKWEPSPRELCWFWSGNKLEEATLSKFHSYTKHGVFKTIYDSFKYCEPFLNSKPSWFED